MVDLTGLGERRPHQLSGGQQQRVALARALVFEPEIVLMDEPLGALDKKLREQMQIEIKHLHEQLGMTVAYVTHDQGEALTMSDRVAIMNDGLIRQVGSPQEVYEKPANAFVANFIGENNAFEGRIEGIDGRELRCQAGFGRHHPRPVCGGARERRNGPAVAAPRAPGHRAGRRRHGEPVRGQGGRGDLFRRPQPGAPGHGGAGRHHRAGARRRGRRGARARSGGRGRLGPGTLPGAGAGMEPAARYHGRGQGRPGRSQPRGETQARPAAALPERLPARRAAAALRPRGVRGPDPLAALFQRR